MFLTYVYLGVAIAFILVCGFLMLYMKLYDSKKKENEKLKAVLAESQKMVEVALKSTELYKRESKEHQEAREKLAKRTAKEIVAKLYPHVENGRVAEARAEIRKIIQELT